MIVRWPFWYIWNLNATHTQIGYDDWQFGGQDARDSLRLSNDETQKLTVMRDAIGDMKPPHALGYHHGASLARDILLLRWASFEQMTDNADWHAAAAGAEQVFPIKAQ